MTTIKHQKKVCAIALAAMFTGVPSFAGIVGIDAFNITTQQLAFDPPPGGPNVAAGSTDFDEANAPEAIGGFRDLFISTSKDISFNDSGDVAVVSAIGQVQVSNTVNTNIDVALTWDGGDNQASVDTGGLGGLDLIDGTNTGILVDINFADLGVDMAFNIWDTSGNQATVSRSFSSQVQDEQVFFAYGDLVGNSVDLTSVGAIQLLVSGPTAYDVDFNLLQSINPDQPPSNNISAPATLALVGIGMVGVGAARRKRL